jgi:hypothetical protein
VCVLMCLKLFYTQVVMLVCGSGTETMWWDGRLIGFGLSSNERLIFWLHRGSVSFSSLSLSFTTSTTAQSLT